MCKINVSITWNKYAFLNRQIHDKLITRPFLRAYLRADQWAAADHGIIQWDWDRKRGGAALLEWFIILDTEDVLQVIPNFCLETSGFISQPASCWLSLAVIHAQVHPLARFMFYNKTLFFIGGRAICRPGSCVLEVKSNKIFYVKFCFNFFFYLSHILSKL